MVATPAFLAVSRPFLSTETIDERLLFQRTEASTVLGQTVAVSCRVEKRSMLT